MCNKSRAVAEPRLGLEGPGLTLGSQYISLKLELSRALIEGARPSFCVDSPRLLPNLFMINIRLDVGSTVRLARLVH